MFRGFVPDHVLRALANHASKDVRNAAQRSLTTSSRHRTIRHLGIATNLFLGGSTPAAENRLVYTANGTTAEPGALVRKEGGPPVNDPAVNAAYDDAGLVYDFYKMAFGRISIDGAGMPIISTVHYDQNYDNAFWDGRQMVYGDGDGHVFRPFVTVIDIPGHEMSHGVTQYLCNLDYRNQSGALNEHFSDAMGSLVKQYKLGHDATNADWLIGEGIFYPTVNGRALRDMRHPGTAYDDPQMGGRDPQPNNMADFVHTSEDDGGVHINSGIPNKAFADACYFVGGKSWEKVGLVWYKTAQVVSSQCNFQQWADKTVEIGGTISPVVSDAIRTAWAGVGIKTAGPSTPPPPPPPPPPPGHIDAKAILQTVDATVRRLEKRVDPGMLGQIEMGTLKIANAAIDADLRKLLGV